MKKAYTRFLCYVFALLLLVMAFMNVFNKVMYSILENKITDSVAEKSFLEKFRGEAIQEIIFSKKDTLPIYGSSELSTTDIPYNPSNIFSNKPLGFYTIPIGRGNSQSLIHAINFAALKDNLQNKKVVFIISPQWFTSSGLESKNFPINFSEIQYYKLMNDFSISKDIKKSISKRVYDLSINNDSLKSVNHYAELNSSDCFYSKVLSLLSKPNYYLMYKVLSIKDKIETIKAIDSMPSEEKYNKNQIKKYINWDEELIKANSIAKDKTNNNEFFINNSYYDKYIKDNLEKCKGIYKNQSYLNSPEYDDLKILLEICKTNNIKPLFVSVPVNKKWYDYCEFPKEDVAEYYSKVSSIVKSYNFDLLDLSSHEEEPYLLKDTMHLGWKGWIYIDREIDEYYNSNR